MLLKLYLFIIVILQARISFSLPTAVDLRCEHLLSPLGVDNLQPMLSWIPVVDSSTKAIIQTSFLIEVSLSSSFSAIYFTNNQTTNHTEFIFPSNIIQYDTTYYWRITWAGCVFNNCSQSFVSVPSDPTTFTTTVSPSLWKTAPFLSCKNVGACDFIRSPVFTAPGTPIRAMLHLSTAGWIEAYINNQKVETNIVLEGSWTQYNVRLPTTTYNVTDYIVNGNNVIGLFLGNGWWGHLGHRATGTIVLSITLENSNNPIYIIPDANTWYGNSGPILGDDIYNGEVYDLRQERPNWTSPTYDIRGWDNTTIVNDPILQNTSLTWQRVQPVMARRDASQIISAISVTQPVNSTQYVIDYGVNSAGWTRFILPANCPSSTSISLRHAENLFSNGTIDQGNLRTAQATDTIICDGRNISYVYEPRFTYHGFRYVGIDNWPTNFVLPDVSMFFKIEVHNAVEWDVTVGSNSLLPSSRMQNRNMNNSTGSSFNSTSSLLPSSFIQFGNINNATGSSLNIIQDLIVRGQLSNLYGGVPTDCPQRDERQGWAFDGSVSSESAASNFDMQAFYKGWLQSIIDAQNSATILNDCSPNSPIYPDCQGAVCDTNPHLAGLFGYQPADVSWGGAINVIFDLLIRHYHDIETLNTATSAVFAWADYLLRVADKSPNVGLVTYHWYGDWLQPNKVSSDELTSQQTSAFSFLLTLRASITAAQLTNNTNAEIMYTQAYELGVSVYKQVYLNTTSNCYGSGSQAEQVYPAYLDFFSSTENNYTELIDFVNTCLIPAIIENDYHVDTGIVSTKYLLEVLSRIERTDIGLILALQEDFPSWIAMFKQFGQTCITEHWDPISNPSGDDMSSRNHPAFSSIGSWMYQAILGIRSGDEISVEFSGPGLVPFMNKSAIHFQEDFGFRKIFISPEYVINNEVMNGNGGMRSNSGWIGLQWQNNYNSSFTMNVTLPVSTIGIIRFPGIQWNANSVSIMETGLCSNTTLWINGIYQSNHTCEGIYNGYNCGIKNDRVCFSTGSGYYQFMMV